ncbi:hypothetical protein [Saccharopolyspora sp. 6V]|uniref:hypothetical protein n=1 Tax=Saccharopolyspora sp. 6V TaxID=2877239 RepID=UPI001CD4C9AF|nr:hypothetical protein [Saccharopolyspora sp. 6V]MCA1195127.1 hypothetical protein [Saccharopolyspora sp. 6V]
MPASLPVHPVTGLRALGHTRRGPIWPVLGGDGTGDGNTSDAPAADAGQQSQPTGDTGQAGQQPTDGQHQGDADDLAALDPATLAAMVRDLRKENGSARTNAKQQAAEQAKQDVAQQIGRALGLVADDQKADPQALADQLTAERDAQATAAKAAAVELAIWKAADTHGANAQALTDSRSFLAALDQLDPAADDYGTKVGEAVKKAATDHPHYRAAGQAPARSSGQHTGRTGDQAKPRNLTDAVARHYGRG